MGTDSTDHHGFMNRDVPSFYIRDDPSNLCHPWPVSFLFRVKDRGPTVPATPHGKFSPVRPAPDRDTPASDAAAPWRAGSGRWPAGFR